MAKKKPGKPKPKKKPPQEETPLQRRQAMENLDFRPRKLTKEELAARKAKRMRNVRRLRREEERQRLAAAVQRRADSQLGPAVRAVRRALAVSGIDPTEQERIAREFADSEWPNIWQQRIDGAPEGDPLAEAVAWVDGEIAAVHAANVEQIIDLLSMLLRQSNAPQYTATRNLFDRVRWLTRSVRTVLLERIDEEMAQLLQAAEFTEDAARSGDARYRAVGTFARTIHSALETGESPTAALTQNGTFVVRGTQTGRFGSTVPTATNQPSQRYSQSPLEIGFGMRVDENGQVVPIAPPPPGSLAERIAAAARPGSDDARAWWEEDGDVPDDPEPEPRTPADQDRLAAEADAHLAFLRGQAPKDAVHLEPVRRKLARRPEPKKE